MKFFVIATPLLLSCAGFAQTPTAASKPVEFEVASVRPSGESPQGQVNVGIRIDGSQFHVNYLTLKDYIGIAYSIRVSQISGPDWISSQRFEISATLPPGGAGRSREMLQTLLADRFKLKFHREKKEFSVYALLPGKPPLKLKEVPYDPTDDAEPQGTTTVSGGGSAAGVGVSLGHGASYSFVPNKFEAKKITMEQFAPNLERFADRPIVDMTGLAGRYDLSFDINAEDYQPMLIRAAVNSGVSLPPQVLKFLDGSSSSVLADAIAQTGLKLEARKAPLDIIVVDDGLKMPTAN